MPFPLEPGMRFISRYLSKASVTLIYCVKPARNAKVRLISAILCKIVRATYQIAINEAGWNSSGQQPLLPPAASQTTGALFSIS
jgi:hypothetical protein